MSQTRALLEQAGQARARGDIAGARQAIGAVLRAEPGNPAGLNMLGLIEVSAGAFPAAIDCFTRAVAADPRGVPLWLNLADAHRRAGSAAEQLAALEGALVVDPYAVPAMAQKAELLDGMGRHDDAIRAFRALAKMVPDPSRAPPQLREVLERGAAAIAAEDQRRRDAVAPAIAQARAGLDPAALRRAEVYLDARYGERKIYRSEPSGPLFPFLPQEEYFDQRLFPWFDALEAGTAAIRAELLALLPHRETAFTPYVSFPPGVPVNQWAELQNSSRWDSFFLWKDGVALESAIARCPKTAALMERLPLLDIAGRGPTVMFSLLSPRTTIPSHTGTTNIRATVHLPLIVPPGCRFRVGGETRDWREGEAWAFDDTIEHEAWNDSDAVRVILIVDVWNPYLTDAERAIVRSVGG